MATLSKSEPALASAPAADGEVAEHVAKRQAGARKASAEKVQPIHKMTSGNPNIMTAMHLRLPHATRGASNFVDLEAKLASPEALEALKVIDDAALADAAEQPQSWSSAYLAVQMILVAVADPDGYKKTVFEVVSHGLTPNDYSSTIGAYANKRNHELAHTEPHQRLYAAIFADLHASFQPAKEAVKGRLTVTDSDGNVHEIHSPALRRKIFGITDKPKQAAAVDSDGNVVASKPKAPAKKRTAAAVDAQDNADPADPFAQSAVPRAPAKRSAKAKASAKAAAAAAAAPSPSPLSYPTPAKK